MLQNDPCLTRQLRARSTRRRRGLHRDDWVARFFCDLIVDFDDVWLGDCVLILVASVTTDNCIVAGKKDGDQEAKDDER